VGLSRFGVFGLAVMGQNLARNIARRGTSVAVYNRTRARTDEFIARYAQEGSFQAAATPAELAAYLERPRRILLMVKAGPPVDETIDELAPHLEPGDILIDGGNSLYTDTERRVREMEARGLLYLGMGVSGGEEGALNGPSLMPGGSRQAYEQVEAILKSIAAVVDGEPCCAYIGPGGAGHYVKMVHNGIEYADMQLIAEAYDLLRRLQGLEPPELAKVFAEWNEGELQSFLIEITARILAKKDDRTGRSLVDVILDEAEQKGTGRWTSQSALELGVPATAITAAVFARVISALREQRLAASKALPGPAHSPQREKKILEEVRQALLASMIVAYAQGFELMAAASAELGWQLSLSSIATIWRGGCIIRARLLEPIRQAFAADPNIANLLLAHDLTEALGRSQPGWRRVVGLAAEAGVAAPAYSAALAYYDGYRSERTPANLIQGLRDYFGAHSYRRIDVPGSFHTRWAQDQAEVEVEL
jgi:6-phosphogluconate dehydrogenase